MISSLKENKMKIGLFLFAIMMMPSFILSQPFRIFYKKLKLSEDQKEIICNLSCFSIFAGMILAFFNPFIFNVSGVGFISLFGLLQSEDVEGKKVI